MPNSISFLQQLYIPKKLQYLRGPTDVGTKTSSLELVLEQKQIDFDQWSKRKIFTKHILILYKQKQFLLI